MIFHHAVGMMYKTGKLEVTSDVRSKPLEQKRKRGRPANLTLCLSRSPPNRDTVGETIATLPEDISQVELSPETSSAPASVFQPLSTPMATTATQAKSANKGRPRRKLALCSPSSTSCPAVASSSPTATISFTSATLRKSTRAKKSSSVVPSIAPAKRKENFSEYQITRNLITSQCILDLKGEKIRNTDVDIQQN